MIRGRWLFTCALGWGLAGGCHLAEPAAQRARGGGALPASSTTDASAAVLAPTPPPAAADTPSDAEFWRRSRDPAIVAAGRAAFNGSSCRTCHGVGLTGGPGPNLTDRLWLHGGTPREVFRTITTGVPSKGMPTWGPILGPSMIADLVAFIFSYHEPGEPIEVQASFTPFAPIYE